MEGYLDIQETDSVHAATLLVTTASRLQRVLLDGRWPEALATADAQDDQVLRTTCLQRLGCHSLAARCAGLEGRGEPTGESAMEAAWRMGQWGDLGHALALTHPVAGTNGVWK